MIGLCLFNLHLYYSKKLSKLQVFHFGSENLILCEAIRGHAYTIHYSPLLPTNTPYYLPTPTNTHRSTLKCAIPAGLMPLALEFRYASTLALAGGPVCVAFRSVASLPHGLGTYKYCLGITYKYYLGVKYTLRCKLGVSLGGVRDSYELICRENGAKLTAFLGTVVFSN